MMNSRVLSQRRTVVSRATSTNKLSRRKIFLGRVVILSIAELLITKRGMQGTENWTFRLNLLPVRLGTFSELDGPLKPLVNSSGRSGFCFTDRWYT